MDSISPQSSLPRDYSRAQQPENSFLTTFSAISSSPEPSLRKNGACSLAQHRLASGTPPLNLSSPATPCETGGPSPGSLASEDPNCLTPAQESHLEAVQCLLDDETSPPNAYVIDDQRPENLDWKYLENSKNFTMRLKGAKAEDALVAAGVALAKGTPSLYVVDNRKELPWFLREADQSYPGLVQVLEKSAQGRTDLTSAIAKTTQPAPHQSSQTPYDTFLGCMMSGLSDQQYAEGRSHLQALNQTLKERFASPHNFCEGINVGSTNSFGTPKESLKSDLDAVRGSKNCVFYAYDQQSRPSGMWVELGAAIAWKKPCTLVIPNRQCLPPCLNQRELPKNLTIIEYQDHQHFLERLGSPDGAAELTGQHTQKPEHR